MKQQMYIIKQFLSEDIVYLRIIIKLRVLGLENLNNNSDGSLKDFLRPWCNLSLQQIDDLLYAIYKLKLQLRVHIHLTYQGEYGITLLFIGHIKLRNKERNHFSAKVDCLVLEATARVVDDIVQTHPSILVSISKCSFEYL